MPRVANETSALLADFQSRLANLIEVPRTEGRTQALTEIRSLVSGGLHAPVKRGRGRPKGSKNKAKPAKKRKNSWTGLSPADRLARVNAIRKGKGLPPKSA